MTKLLKRTLIMVLALCMTLSLGLFVACSDDIETKESVITLNKTEFALKIGEVAQIVPTYEAEEGVELEYLSSDAETVSVDEAGEIKALKLGAAKITVTYGSASATCNVTVGLSGEAPLISTIIDEGTTTNLPIGSTLPTSPAITFNGEIFDDATFTFTFSDSSVCTVENGVITAAKVGKTDVTIEANWRGITGLTLVRKFTVNVTNNVELSINGGLGGVINIYSVANHGGETFAVENDFIVTAKEINSDKALTPTFDVVEGDNLIEIENNKVVSLGKGGKAVVKISCKDSNDLTHEAYSTVNIIKSIADYNTSSTPVLFSAADGEIDLNAIFGGAVTLTDDATVSSGEALTVTENKVMGVITGNEIKNAKLTVYTDSVGYNVYVEACEKVIDEPSDLNYFRLGNDDHKSVTKEFTGYYVLANDIDCSEYVQGATGFISTDKEDSYNSKGLRGTFDGRGHIIKNLTFGRTEEDFAKYTAEKRKEYNYSLFGIVGNGGVIKDLALSDVAFDIPRSECTKGCHAVIATQFIGGRMENVYIGLKGLSVNTVSAWSASAGLAYRIGSGSELKNVILEIEDDGSATEAIKKFPNTNSIGIGSMYGNRGGMNTMTDEEINELWQNVFIISNLVLSRTYNDDATRIHDASNITGNDFVKRPVVKRYESIAEMSLDNTNDYSDFGAHWITENVAVPFWKGLFKSDYASILLDDELTSVLNKSVQSEYPLSLLGVTPSNTPVYSVVEGDSVSISGDMLTAVKPGASKIKVEYMYNGANCVNELELQVTLDVDETVITVTDKFSAMHGMLPLTTIFGSSSPIIYATMGGKPLEVSADGTSILGIKTTSNTGTETIEDIIVYNDTIGKKITIQNAYAGILTTAKDLEVFNIMGLDAGAKHGGYYELGGNIVCPNDFMLTTQGKFSDTFNVNNHFNAGFVGTFDGKGYTISNLTFGNNATDQVIVDGKAAGTDYKGYSYSLFGILGKGAVVKNFAITGVEFKPCDDTNQGMHTVLASYICGATIQDVYVQVDALATGGYSRSTGGLAFVIYFNGYNEQNNTPVTMNNVIVDITGTTAPVGHNGTLIPRYGSLASRHPALNTNYSTATATNVYVLSSFKLAYNESSATDDVDASNTTGTTNMYSTIKRYDNKTAWESAQATTQDDFTSFEGSAYWNTTGTVPVWKGIV